MQVGKFHSGATLLSLLRVVLVLGIMGTSHLSNAQDSDPFDFPPTAKACYDLGEKYIEGHDWQNALKAFQACLRIDPGYADAYYSRGLTREHFGWLEEALTDFNIYLEWRPEHRDALYSRAQLRYRLRQYAFAKEDFRRLLTLPEGETTTVFFRQSIHTGEVNQIFTTQGANKAHLYNSLGLASMGLDSIQEAISWFDSALYVLQNEADFYINRGTAYERAGDLRKSRQDYEHAIQIDPNHAIAKNNLSALSRKNREGIASPEESVDLLNAAIRDNPRVPYAYAERGFQRMETGDLEGALEDYSAAIQIDSSQADYFLNRGLVLERLNQLQLAYFDYSKALSLDEKYQKALLNRGNLLSKLNRLEEAIEDYGVAILYHPNYGPAYYNRSIARHRLGQTHEACSDLHKAQALGMTIKTKVMDAICKPHK